MGTTLTPIAIKLLDAAEQRFADFGYTGISVRDIVRHAAVKLGAVPYYFGSRMVTFVQNLRAKAMRGDPCA